GLLPVRTMMSGSRSLSTRSSSAARFLRNSVAVVARIAINIRDHVRKINSVGRAVPVAVRNKSRRGLAVADPDEVDGRGERGVLDQLQHGAEAVAIGDAEAGPDAFDAVGDGATGGGRLGDG